MMKRLAVAALVFTLSACAPETFLEGEEGGSPALQELRSNLDDATEECRERGGVFVVGRGSDKFKSCIAPEAIIELDANRG